MRFFRGLPAGFRTWPRPAVTIEWLTVLVCAWIAATCNRTFIAKVVGGESWSSPSTWFAVLTIAVALAALHAAVVGLPLTRRSARPVLAVVTIAAAVAAYYIDHYGVYLDPGMVRNAWRTESKEALDLLGAGLVMHLLWVAVPPLVLIGWVRIRPSGLLAGVARRLLATVCALTLVAGATFVAYPWLAAPIRSQHELRYQITPANLIWSAGRAAVATREVRAGPRTPIAVDAVRLRPAGPARPLVLLVFVGETARAANWGLNGYARDTTPLLRQRRVVNFTDVTSCGTDTETSVPCLFSPYGRRHYDEARIRGSESLLHVLARVGYRVSWRDNQTGCKGVCDGLPFETIDTGLRPDCLPGRCLDDHLLEGLDERIDGRDQIIVLHMIGSHGPAYDHRYPAGDAPYQPICGRIDLSRCDPAALVNSYDNTIRQTDRVLAEAIDLLERRSATHDVALVYVSDHGESLGEHRLYLHGVPWRIAPDVQRKVPMVMWLSDGFRRRLNLDAGCLDRQARLPVTHDYLFHTLLGMLDVTTATRDPALDLLAPCRRPDVLARTRAADADRDIGRP